MHPMRTCQAEARAFGPPDAREVTHERRLGRYVRAIILWQGVDAAKIEAKYEDGILELTLLRSKTGLAAAVALEGKLRILGPWGILPRAKCIHGSYIISLYLPTMTAGTASKIIF